MIVEAIVQNRHRGTRNQYDNAHVVDFAPQIAMGLGLLFKTVKTATAHQTQECTQQVKVDDDVVRHSCRWKLWNQKQICEEHQ